MVEISRLNPDYGLRVLAGSYPCASNMRQTPHVSPGGFFLSAKLCKSIVKHNTVATQMGWEALHVERRGASCFEVEA